MTDKEFHERLYKYYNEIREAVADGKEPQEYLVTGVQDLKDDFKNKKPAQPSRWPETTGTGVGNYCGFPAGRYVDDDEYSDWKGYGIW
jgi:hypothetical protein